MGCTGWMGTKRKNWDDYNSIINKNIVKKEERKKPSADAETDALKGKGHFPKVSQIECTLSDQRTLSPITLIKNNSKEAFKGMFLFNGLIIKVLNFNF